MAACANSLHGCTENCPALHVYQKLSQVSLAALNADLCISCNQEALSAWNVDEDTDEEDVNEKELPAAQQDGHMDADINAEKSRDEMEMPLPETEGKDVHQDEKEEPQNPDAPIDSAPDACPAAPRY